MSNEPKGAGVAEPPAETCSFVSKVLMVFGEFKAETRRREVPGGKLPDASAPAWLEG